MEKKTDSLIKAQPTTPSARFTTAVIAEFQSNNGGVALSNYQQRLVQNYFVNLDQALATAELGRLRKNEKYRDQLPITWNNVDMSKLAVNIVACARIGFDPAVPNHINLIPFKDNNTNKYNVTFIEGYRGKELKAKKYGYDVPSDVIIELVYSTDEFKPLKKDKNNSVETYTFKVINTFDRGEVVGGFYYFVYDDETKNKLAFFNIKQIEKRKPKYASAEFWGGEKIIYKDGKKSGTETIEGWREEMLWKTVSRMAYSAIPIDSQKIDDAYINLLRNDSDTKMIENSPAKKQAEQENAITLDVDSEDVTQTEPKNEIEKPKNLPKKDDKQKETNPSATIDPMNGDPFTTENDPFN